MTTELIIQDVSGILGDPKSPFAAKKEQLIITASHCLEQGLPNLYCKGPSSKYFLLCWPYGLCYNYSTPSFYQEKSSYVPIELYLQTQEVDRIQPMGYCSPTPILQVCYQQALFLLHLTCLYVCVSLHDDMNFRRMKIQEKKKKKRRGK